MRKYIAFVVLALLAVSVPAEMVGQGIITIPKPQHHVKPNKPNRPHHKPTKPTKPTKPGSNQHVYKPNPKSDNYGKPLTQYAVISADSYYAYIRSEEDLIRILTSYGFKVTTYSHKYSDSSSSYTQLKATRDGTTVEIIGGDEKSCIINFKTPGELDIFMDSMIRSFWEYHDGYYLHQQTMAGNSNVIAKISGYTVTIMESYRYAK